MMNNSDTKLTHYLTKFHEKHGNLYDYSKIKSIKNAKTKIEIICKKHGSFMQTPDGHLRGGCPKCGRERTIHANKTDRNELLSTCRARFPHITYPETCSTIDNIATQLVELECEYHGSFKTTLYNHLKSKHGCPKCASEKGSETIRGSTEDFVKRAILVHGNVYDYSMVDYVNSSTPVKIICPVHGEFEILPQNHVSTYNKCGCRKCAVAGQRSFVEKELYDKVKQFVPDVVSSDREVIRPKELDMFLPTNKVAIEYDGLYWHSSGSQCNDRRIKAKHLDKTTLCEKQGIQLFHVFEGESIDKWMSVIRNAIGQSSKIYARKCDLVEVSYTDSVNFLNENHLQGACRSSIRIGLKYNGTLVALMTFGKSRYNNVDWELLRFCSILDHTIVGGASKLLNFFMKNYKGSIVSYANRRWSLGTLYDVLGFKRLRVSPPCYWYTKGSEIYHRSMFMKHKLAQKLDNFDPSLSESVNMYNHGYRRIWDSGHIVYILEN